IMEGVRCVPGHVTMLEVINKSKTVLTSSSLACRTKCERGTSSMKRVAAWCPSSLALGPAYSFAAGGTVVCGAVNFIRAQGTELRNTVISLRNLDLVNPTTVERIT